MSKEDQELLEMMNGENKPLHPDTIHITLGEKPKATERDEPKTARQEVPKKEAKDQAEVKAVHIPTHNYMDGKWEPVKPAPNAMDKLKACAKWLGLFGSLSCLVFYWEQAGLMASSIAVPTMCVCTALGGWGLGKIAGGSK